MGGKKALEVHRPVVQKNDWTVCDVVRSGKRVDNMGCFEDCSDLRAYLICFHQTMGVRPDAFPHFPRSYSFFNDDSYADLGMTMSLIWKPLHYRHQSTRKLPSRHRVSRAHYTDKVPVYGKKNAAESLGIVVKIPPPESSSWKLLERFHPALAQGKRVARPMIGKGARRAAA